MDLPASAMHIDLTPTFGELSTATRLAAQSDNKAGAVFIGALGMMACVQPFLSPKHIAYHAQSLWSYFSTGKKGAHAQATT